MALILWHNPRCSKSRAALALLQDRGLDPEIRDYQKTPPSLAELRDLLGKLDQPVQALVRWKDGDLSTDAGDTEILTALAANPKLIERPVLITDTAARIGRPPERVLEIL